MTDQEILELAAILVAEHGHTALRAAEIRLQEHELGSDGHRLWTRIAAEVTRLLDKPRRSRRANTHPEARRRLAAAAQ